MKSRLDPWLLLNGMLSYLTDNRINIIAVCSNSKFRYFDTIFSKLEIVTGILF